MSNIRTQPTIGSQTASEAFEAKHLVAAGPVTLLSLLGFNNGPDQFIQVHDSKTEPADGAAPLYMMKVPAGQPFFIDTPLKFANGLYVCNSSTPDTKTIGAADCWFVTRHL